MNMERPIITKLERETDSLMGKRNPSAHHSWEHLPFGKYEINKPTIFCLGGNGCVDVVAANGLCKFVAHLVGFRESERDLVDMYDYVDIIGFSYGNEIGYSGDFAEYEIDKIVNGMFLPLCVDKKGHPFPLDTAIKNFSNVTFFSYCHGATELAKIMTKLEVALTGEYGYSNVAKDRLFSSLRHITYTPNTDIEYLPSVRFFSLSDSRRMDLKYEYNNAFGEKLNGIKIARFPKGEVLGRNSACAEAESVCVFSSKFNNELENKINEHNIAYLKRSDDDWKISGFAGVKGTNGDAVSQMMAYALSESVAHGFQNNISKDYIPRQSLKNTQKSLESILSQFKPSDLEKKFE